MVEMQRRLWFLYLNHTWICESEDFHQEWRHVEIFMDHEDTDAAMNEPLCDLPRPKLSETTHSAGCNSRDTG